MNTYKIQHKIKTLACLNMEPKDGKFNVKCEIAGFVFTQCGFTPRKGWLKGDSWIVEKVVKEKDWTSAINKFRKELEPIVQKISFVSQSYFDFLLQPFIIFRLNDNSDKIFIYRHTQEIKVCGFHFDEKALDQYYKISTYDKPYTFKFMQECCNTIGYIPKLLLLFSVLEAMCDVVEKEKDGKIMRSYDKNQMKKILGNNLYDKFFGKNGLRHKLDHGEFTYLIYGDEYFAILYDKIMSNINVSCKTDINNPKVELPQRHFFGTYEVNLFCLASLKNGAKISLGTVIKFFSKKLNKNGKYRFLDFGDNKEY